MKRFIGSSVLGLVLLSGMAYGLALPNLGTATYPLRGESDLYRDGRTSRVDWVVSRTPLTTGASQSDFNFAYNFNTGTFQGDYTTYADNSSWYYYYQIENTSGNFATSFALKLEPNSVITAGFILNVDLDTDLDISHLDTDVGLAGELESGTAGTPVNFTSASFDSNPPVPNISLNFAFGFKSGFESTVFFITSDSPPEYLIAELLPGAQGPEGMLPVPMQFHDFTIPEPTSMILIGISAVMLGFRKKRK